MYILSTGMVWAATTPVSKGSEVQGGCDCGTLETRIPRSGEPELLAFQSLGETARATPTLLQGRNVQTGPSGSALQLGEGFMEEVIFALGLEGR